MALSYQEVVDLTKAKSVGGQIVAGLKDKRIIVGKKEKGIFSLTEEGKEYIANLQKAKSPPKAPRKKKEEVAQPETPVELDSNFSID